MIISEDEHLAHYGILRRSGRYPWGSSNNANTRNRAFLDYVAEMKAKGLTEPEIAKGLGLDDEGNKTSTTQLRAAKSIANNQLKQARIIQAQRLQDKGLSGVAAATKMGIPESSYRALLAPGEKDKADILTSTSEMLKREVAEKHILMLVLVLRIILVLVKKDSTLLFYA